jgi:hypothetical protein
MAPGRAAFLGTSSRGRRLPFMLLLSEAPDGLLLTATHHLRRCRSAAALRTPNVRTASAGRFPVPRATKRPWTGIDEPRSGGLAGRVRCRATPPRAAVQDRRSPRPTSAARCLPLPVSPAALLLPACSRAVHETHPEGVCPAQRLNVAARATSTSDADAVLNRSRKRLMHRAEWTSAWPRIQGRYATQRLAPSWSLQDPEPRQA